MMSLLIPLCLVGGVPRREDICPCTIGEGCAREWVRRRSLSATRTFVLYSVLCTDISRSGTALRLPVRCCMDFSVGSDTICL